MQVNGWVLGIGSAIALVSVAQAQIPQPTGFEITQLKAQVAALQNTVTGMQNANKQQGISILEAKGDIKKLQTENAALKTKLGTFEQMFLSHKHMHKGDATFTGTAWCGTYGCNGAALFPKAS